MSRVGKKPIPLPATVKLKIGEQLQVEGPKGKLIVPIPAGVRIEQEGNVMNVLRDGDKFAALHGLTRALAANAVLGVSTGFIRELDIVGIGYRCDQKDPRVLTFTLGYSHPIVFHAPEGITVTTPTQTEILVAGADENGLFMGLIVPAVPAKLLL